MYLSLVRFKGHFPGGPGLAGTRLSPVWILLELRVMEVVSGDNRSYMTNKAPVKMSPPANQHTYLYRPVALRIHGPTNHVKALKGNWCTVWPRHISARAPRIELCLVLQNFDSQPRPLRTTIYSACYPFGVGLGKLNGKGKSTSTGLSVRWCTVESVSDLLLKCPVLRGRWPVTPSPLYLRPSKDTIYSSQRSGLGAQLRRNFLYIFSPGLGLNPGPQRGSTVR